MLHRFLFGMLCFSLPSLAMAGQPVVLQGKGKLVMLDAQGKVTWEMPWGGIHDIHLLKNGNLMVQQGSNKVVEIDVKTKKVIWTYDSAKQNGNEGKRVEVHAFQPLEDGKIMIAESGPGRIIEVDRDGKIHKQFPLQVSKNDPHRDTRLVRKLESGTYLVCHEGDGIVKEYDAEGKVIWEFPIPLFDQKPRGGHGPEAWGNQTFAAVRLPNHNTLITTGNGHSVIEVSPQKEIVWHLKQKDLKGITLAWVTTVQVLPNGNYLIGNCHAGKDQPLLIEVEPKTKQVVWQLDQWNLWGNDVSNSAVLK